MIRLVKAVDATHRFSHGDALVINFLGVADHPRHRAQPARNAHGARIGERWQPAIEHPRVQFIRLAIDVDVAARKVRPHHRMAPGHHAFD